MNRHSGRACSSFTRSFRTYTSTDPGSHLASPDEAEQLLPGHDPPRTARELRQQAKLANREHQRPPGGNRDVVVGKNLERADGEQLSRGLGRSGDLGLGSSGDVGLGGSRHALPMLMAGSRPGVTDL